MELVKPIRYEKNKNFIFRWELKSPGKWILKRIYDIVEGKLVHKAPIEMLWGDKPLYIRVCHIQDKTPVGYTTAKPLLPYLVNEGAYIVDNIVMVRYNGNMYNLSDRTPNDDIMRKFVIFPDGVLIDGKKLPFYEDINLPMLVCKCKTDDVTILTLPGNEKAYVFLCIHSGELSRGASAST